MQIATTTTTIFVVAEWKVNKFFDFTNSNNFVEFKMKIL